MSRFSMPLAQALNPRPGRDRGVALVMTLGVVLLLSMAVITAATNASGHLAHVSLQVYEKQAVRVAEAGLADAIVAIRADPSWRGFSPARRSMPSTPAFSYQVEVTNNVGGAAAVTAADGTVVPVGALYLRSVGRATRSVERTVTSLAVMGSSSVFRNAVFGDQSVSMTGSSVIDSWNSSLGAYAPSQTATQGAPVGTNATSRGAISLGGNTYVDGNLYIGPGGDPTTAVTGADQATGTVSVSGSTMPMPAPTPPPLPPGPYANVKLTGGTRNLAPGTYGDLSASGGSTVVLQTGTYVFAAGKGSTGSVTLKGGSNLVVPAGAGPVKIYFMGTWDTGGGNLINETGLPSNLIIAGTSTATKATLSGNAQAYFGFYAPSADITIVGNNSVFGSIVGQSVTIPGNASVHYDTSLATSDAFRVETNWVLTALHRG